LSHAVDNDGVVFDFPSQSAIWSVNGGVLGAAALLAAREQAPDAAPLSISCTLPKSAKPGAASARASVIAKTGGMSVIGVDLRQDDQSVLLGQVVVGRAAAGPEHFVAAMPPAPHPDELRSLEDILPPGLSQSEFWSIVEERPINRKNYESRRSLTPRVMRWFRHREVLQSGPYWDACRLLPIMDPWGVLASHYGGVEALRTAYAPTIQYTVHFYSGAPEGGWILCDASIQAAKAGLMTAHLTAWSLAGDLLAQGIFQEFVKERPAAAAAT
jgi:acyl-CoA thioesterase